MVEDLHGTLVGDPYRWLEDGDAAEVHEWVRRQNERTREALDARPDRGRWHERLVALMQLPVVLGVKVRGERLFALERAAGAEQAALVLRSAVDPRRAVRPLIDPVDLTDSPGDAAAAIDWFEPSPNGTYVAFGVSEGGTEQSVLRVLDVAQGELLVDEIPRTRAATIAWTPDERGFWYTRYPDDDEYHRTVHFHRLGDDRHADTMVWDALVTPHAWPDVQASPDGRHLLVEVMEGWGRIAAHLLDTSTGEWTAVVEGVDAISSFAFAGDHLVGTTTLDAPRGRVVAAPLAAPGVAHWTTIVAEGPATLGRPVVCGDELLVVATERAVDRVERFTGEGVPLGAVPGLGTIAVTALTARRDAPHAFVVPAGFTNPPSVHRWTPTDGLVPWGEVTTTSSSSTVPDLRVTQVHYPSLDGTPIGMFLIHRADVEPSPCTPAILNGYGGFAITETPVWSPLVAAWCAAGGLYALAGLRGGHEEGEAWHEAGRRGCKQNVFDDFHAGADWLVSTGRTSRQHLAIAGGSNGGLLVGAALTQRPDLCRAVWCAVPLLDMIRFPRFLIARLWTDEYGDPDVAEEFAWLWAYSPYHRVVHGTCYPAVLLTTAEGDSRVDPLHARKMAAELQAASSCLDQHPVLLFQEGRAGHGMGKPVGKRADEAADVLAFFGWQLDDGGLTP